MLKELLEKREAMQAEMKGLLAKVTEEKRSFDDEESKRFDELESEIKKIDKTIAAIQSERALDQDAPQVEDDEPETRSIEEREEAVFEAFLRGRIEQRDDVNMTTGDNGAVIPSTIAQKIIEKVHEISPVYSMATLYNVKGSLTIPFYPADSADITMAYADEFDELESTTGKFGNITLTGFLAGALTKVSKSLINNSQFSIVPFVIEHMAQSISRWLEGEILNGTPSKVTGTVAGITQTVTATSATAITADELIDVQESIPDVYQANACWIMNKKTRTAIRKLKDGDGNYLLNKDATAKWGYTLLGKDVYVSENMDALDSEASGKTTVLYGDFSGVAVKLSEEMNIQVLLEKFATQHAVGVVAWMEFDCKVENAQKLAKLVQA